MVDETKYIKRFGLDPDISVLINKYSCFFHGKGIPIPGKLYIFSDCVCFSSTFNPKTLLGSKTKIKILIKDIVFCEFLPKSFGTGIALTSSTEEDGGSTHQFNNLGDNGKMANFLIQEFMEGYLNRVKQRKDIDNT